MEGGGGAIGRLIAIETITVVESFEYFTIPYVEP